MSEVVFAPRPETPPSLSDCYFYHTTDVTGVGLVEGEWDLRNGILAYLGHIPLAGKRVLDVGSATGFLSFHMERQGAQVTSFDLSAADGWDIVPMAQVDPAELDRQRRQHIGRINAGYWLCHHAYDSRCRLAHGSVYAIPRALSPIDIAVYGSILLHLRDPFRALHSGVGLARETAVVTDLMPGARLLPRLQALLLGRAMRFKPRFRKGRPWETWWELPPRLVAEFLGVLGFEDLTISYHSQPLQGRAMPMFTVVGQRTRPTPDQTA